MDLLYQNPVTMEYCENLHTREVVHSAQYDNHLVKLLSTLSGFIASFLTTYSIQDTEGIRKLHNDITVFQLDSYFLS